MQCRTQRLCRVAQQIFRIRFVDHPRRLFLLRKVFRHCGRKVQYSKTTVTRRAAPEGLYCTAAEVRTEEIPARFIPYFAFANRGATEMLVWVLEK